MRFATVVLILAFTSQLQLFAQDPEQRTADQLRRFETSWLAALLNSDQMWLSRFAAGKLNVLPPVGSGLKECKEAVSALAETTLQPSEMKVRISGTIMLLTNDLDRNRSFFFLDTFNKIGGKWQVIASSISPTPANGSSDQGGTEQGLIQLENELANAVAASDTSNAGNVQDRRQWIDARERDGIKSAIRSEMKVRLANDSLAVVTGVDTTVRLDKDGKQVVQTDRFTHTWSRNSTGQWQCVAAHATRLQ
jgi:ketosteroid isomerase-like protein